MSPDSSGRKPCPHPDRPMIAICKKTGREFCAECFRLGLADCPRRQQTCDQRKDCAVLKIKSLG